MPHFKVKILVLSLLTFACNGSQSIDNQIVVVASVASLLQEPTEKSPELTQLHKGDKVEDLFEVGPRESQVASGEHVFQTPWVKVRTKSGQTGWAMAWALRPEIKQTDWLLQKRMICYFGNALAERRNRWATSVGQTNGEAEMAACWQEGNALRDTFAQLLERKPQGGFSLKFDWLEAALPGFVYQQLGEGGRPYLFANFKIWQQKALGTSGAADDAFFQVCLDMFPKDSIESFFPVWTFQLSETEYASQLGTGQHLEVLLEIDRAQASGTLFQTPLEAVKSSILDDIFDKNVRYWQPKAKILAELDQLLVASPHCLNHRDLDALRIRKKMFEDPEANGLVVNMRSGE